MIDISGCRILNHMVEYDSEHVDVLFAALSNGNRRRIVEQLVEGEAPVKELAEPLDVSLQAVSKHVGVLEDAGLVEREKRGRSSYCRLRQGALGPAVRWIVSMEAFWSDRLDRLEEYLEETSDS